MSSIHETLSSFKRIDREIDVLSTLLVVLVGCVLLRIGWLLYGSRIGEIWTSVAVLGALMSALLISKSASRLLLHNQFYKEDERRRDIVRLTHHAMVILNNLTDLVGYVEHYISAGDKPAAVFVGATRAIEEKWSLFYDRDLNQLLTANAYKLVRDMSGSFFGLTSLGRGLESALSQQALLMPLPKNHLSEAMGGNLAELKKQLDNLYSELEKVRSEVR